jgi:hypothetical protein
MLDAHSHLFNHHLLVLPLPYIGFTAWSSTREPFQVFQLLEAIYGEFDALAKRRRVFKVETVGDCYVSISLVLFGMVVVSYSGVAYCSLTALSIIYSCCLFACRWPSVVYPPHERIMPLSWLGLPATAIPRCVSSPTS